MPPKKLFPKFAEQPTVSARRNYVMRELVALAASGDLYLTDVFAQGEPIRSIAGDCILGFKMRREDRVGGAKIPPELRSYRVRIRAIPHMVQVDRDQPDGTTHTTWEERTTPITFRFGSEDLDETLEYEAARQVMDVYSSADHVRPAYVETGETDVTLPLDQAWWCLKEQGRNVRRAVGKKRQRTWWKCEEVRPGTKSEADKGAKKRGPGSPSKASGEAYSAQ